MSKIIVSGGAGFIGSHAVDALLAQGHELHVIDDLSGGKKENLNPRAVFHRADIRDFEKLLPIFKGAEYLLHFAALPKVQPSLLDPRTTHQVNVDGTLHVLLAARDAGVRRVVYSASSSAYGNQEKLPLLEDMEPRPLSPYGLQKYMGELLCKLFSRIYGLETVSLRYFNVYGPRASTDGAYDLVIGKFLEQRRQNKPLTIVGDGMQSRDFTHVRDVVRANLLAMHSPKVGKGEVINIGGGHNHTILEVADLIGGQRIFIEPRVEPQHSLADITRAKELLDWFPQIDFTKGIQELKTLYHI